MIYFIRSIQGGPIKIGYTVKLQTRLREHERYYGVKFDVLLTMDGDRTTERELHERFSHLRILGRGKRGSAPEFFRPGRELTEFLNIPEEAASSDLDDIIVKDVVRVDIDRRLARLAKVVAAKEGVSVAHLLSELLEGPIRSRAKTFGVESIVSLNQSKMADTDWDVVLAAAGGNIASPKGARDYAILRLIHDCEIRFNELLRLDLCHVDLESETIRIVDGEARDRSWVDLPQITRDALAQWIKQRGANQGPVFIRLDSGRPLGTFPRLDPQGLRKILNTIAGKSKVGSKITSDNRSYI